VNTATTPRQFVEQHWQLLNAYSRSRRFRPAYVPPDEFRQALVLQVLEKHEQFRTDNDGGECPHCGATGCGTWLGWRARRVATDYNRQRQRDQERHVTEEPIEAYSLDVLGIAQYGGHHAMERRAQVAQVLEHATDSQHAAALTVLDDCDGVQVQDRLGIKLPGRNWHLARLRDRITGD
jgi:hypothetical protein